MALDKKFKCRYGCGATFKTASGQRYHENKVHGGLYTRRDKTQTEIPYVSVETNKKEIPEVDDNTDYVKIEEVKYMVAKKVNAKDATEEYECGKCGEKFGELKKFCPNCGCEFE
ncbi:MAG: hypothetical protein ACT6FG_05675 [Methanosarcinaceae archaeon]